MTDTSGSGEHFNDVYTMMVELLNDANPIVRSPATRLYWSSPLYGENNPDW